MTTRSTVRSAILAWLALTISALAQTGGSQTAAPLSPVDAPEGIWKFDTHG